MLIKIHFDNVCKTFNIYYIYIYKSHISILHGMTLAVMEIVITIISWLLSLFDSKGQPIVIMFVRS